MDNPSGPEKSLLELSSHPAVVCLHLSFRSLAVLLYLFGSLFFSFIFSFILVILSLSLDFWIVKNVSGRLLAGLRWWNDTSEDGSRWIYESSTKNINSTDRMLFWWSLYGYFSVWILFGLLAILKLNVLWLPVVLAALSTNAANIVGYTNCDKDAKKSLMARIDHPLFQRLFGIPNSQ